MKNTLLALFVMICVYPRELQIMGSEFSTGTAKSPAYMVELSGMYKGEYTTFTSYIVSMGKAFGFGRLNAPKRITFKEGNVRQLECKL